MEQTVESVSYELLMDEKGGSALSLGVDRQLNPSFLLQMKIGIVENDFAGNEHLPFSLFPGSKCVPSGDVGLGIGAV
jgi:hypothetical protein